MAREDGPLIGEEAKQHALKQLREAITRGDMAPGQRLVEEELAEQFGVTRGGIRAALIDLTAEGLVERIRNRGARVRVVTVEEAVAITECRMVLGRTPRSTTTCTPASATSPGSGRRSSCWSGSTPSWSGTGSSSPCTPGARRSRSASTWR